MSYGSNAARYVEVMKDADVLATAQGLKLEIKEMRGSSPGGFPCPHCNAKTRHGETGNRARPSAGVTTNGKGWKCHGCGTGGDALDLVSMAIAGKKLGQLPQHEKDNVRKHIEDWRGMTGQPPSYRPPPILAAVREEHQYLSDERINACMAECVPVTTDKQVSEYLTSRCIDPAKVQAECLAFALPVHARGVDSWASEGLRLITPTRDVQGNVRGLKARRVDGAEGVKSKSARQCRMSGLVLMDQHDFIKTARRVWIVEGEIKYLQLRTMVPAGEVVIGVGSGLHTPELIALIPRFAQTVIATDGDTKDEAGARYANEILGMMTASQRRNVALFGTLELVNGKVRSSRREV